MTADPAINDEAARNYSLREDIRAYWSERSKTFDLSFGHRISPGPEMNAWASLIRSAIGPKPQRILELACGTGEVTNVLLSLGHSVLGLDFAEPMLDRAQFKHLTNSRARFRLADAEDTMEPDDSYDVVLSRHLVWTLTRPEQALRDWLRVLKPGGTMIVIDGNWEQKTILGRAFAPVIKLLDTLDPPPRHISPEMSSQHADIVGRLPFSDGLTHARLVDMAVDAGFVDLHSVSLAGVRAAQRSIGTLREALSTFTRAEFCLVARSPS